MGPRTLLIDGGGAQTLHRRGHDRRRQPARRSSSTSPRARSPWPARSARPTTGRTPRARSTRARRTVVFAGGTVTGSPHPQQRRVPGARPTIAAGTTLTAGGTLDASPTAPSTGPARSPPRATSARPPRSTAAPAPCSSTGPAPRPSPARPRPPPATCPPLVINKPSGTLTLAGTIRTTNSWTYTAGTVDPGTSHGRLRAATAGDQPGSHSPRRRRSSTAAAHDAYTVRRRQRRSPSPARSTLTDGNAQRDRHRSRPRAPISQASTFDGGTGHAAHQRGRRPDLHRRGHDRRRHPARVGHQQALGHAHPGRHDPDDPQLDVHRGDGRPGHARRSSSRARRPSGSHTLNDVVFNGAGTTYTVAAGHDPHGRRRAHPDRRHHHDRHGRRPGRDQPGLDVRRRDGHPAHQRRRRPDVHRRGHDRRRAPARRWSSTSRRARSPWPARSGPTNNWTYTAGTVDPGTSHGRLRGRHGHLGGHDLLRRHDERRDDDARLGRWPSTTTCRCTAGTFSTSVRTTA